MAAVFKLLLIQQRSYHCVVKLCQSFLHLAWHTTKSFICVYQDIFPLEFQAGDKELGSFSNRDFWSCIFLCVYMYGYTCMWRYMHMHLEFRRQSLLQIGSLTVLEFLK